MARQRGSAEPARLKYWDSDLAGAYKHAVKHKMLITHSEELGYRTKFYSLEDDSDERVVWTPWPTPRPTLQESELIDKTSRAEWQRIQDERERRAS